MTFLIGFHCENGLVLCADSEESDGFNKKFVEKLSIHQLNDGAGICFGSSGDATVCDKFKVRLLEVLDDISYHPQKLESVVEEVLKHVIKKYGQQISILLAHTDREAQATHLYRTYQDHALRPIGIGEFICVGMDTSLAQFLGASILDRFMGVEECLNLGIWITALMKTNTANVSGPTMAFSYKTEHSHWQQRFGFEINAIEKKYPAVEMTLLKYWQGRNPDLYKIENGTAIRQTTLSISQNSEQKP